MVKFESRQHPTEGKGVVEYISISSDAVKDVVHRPATDADRQTYYAQYEAFKAGKTLEAPVEAPVPPVFFEKRKNPKGEEVEYVSIAAGQDRVHRQATDEDREKYKAAYLEFNPEADAGTGSKPKKLAVVPDAPAATHGKEPSVRSLDETQNLSPEELVIQEALLKESRLEPEEAGLPEPHHAHKPKKKK